MSKKQTAVQWLIEQLENNMNGFSIVWKEEFEQAIQMEREQIEEAYNQDLYGGLSGNKKYNNGSDYYTQTYGKCTQQ